MAQRRGAMNNKCAVVRKGVSLHIAFFLVLHAFHATADSKTMRTLEKGQREIESGKVSSRGRGLAL